MALHEVVKKSLKKQRQVAKAQGRQQLSRKGKIVRTEYIIPSSGGDE